MQTLDLTLKLVIFVKECKNIEHIKMKKNREIFFFEFHLKSIKTKIVFLSPSTIISKKMWQNLTLNWNGKQSYQRSLIIFETGTQHIHNFRNSWFFFLKNWKKSKNPLNPDSMQQKKFFLQNKFVINSLMQCTKLNNILKRRDKGIRA